MSKIKEALLIEIQKMIEWAKSPKDVEKHGNKALTILRPLAEEPLQGLRDDVQAVLKKLPHARCHNLEIPEGCGGQCQGADEECAKCLLQSALIKHRAEEPEVREFTAKQLARKFHETYERLAPRFGYETRSASAVSWENVPRNNKNLMIAVCQEIKSDIIDSQAQTIKDQAAEIKDVIKLKDGIIKALNKRLSDLGAQC